MDVIAGWCRRLNDPKDSVAARTVSRVLLLAEALFCAAIIWKVPYTEIDWQAYMAQVEGFIEGERDYTKLEGQTGPLVYPAGFLYIFTALRWLTQGGDIFLGQIVFAGIYLLNLAVVFELYTRSRSVPPWAFALLCLSKRVHSIFVLRLFNDGIAMLLAYTAVLLLISQKPALSITTFSAAVSVKMNVLLMAPSVFAVILMGSSMLVLVVGGICGVILQLALGSPFLLYDYQAYLSRAFEFSRVFFYKWTVNWKFLPEDVFLLKSWALCLLLAHLILLALFAHSKWCKNTGGLLTTMQNFLSAKSILSPTDQRRVLNPDLVMLAIFTGNFIGIVCARSLHYQFYSWYFHSLPFLLWHVNYPVPFKLTLFVVIEFCWNVFPATAVSSLMLLGAHLSLLVGLWTRAAPQTYLTSKERKE